MRSLLPNTAVPLEPKDPMPFSPVQAVETSQSCHHGPDRHAIHGFILWYGRERRLNSLREIFFRNRLGGHQIKFSTRVQPDRGLASRASGPARSEGHGSWQGRDGMPFREKLPPISGKPSQSVRNYRGRVSKVW